MEDRNLVDPDLLQELGTDIPDSDPGRPPDGEDEWVYLTDSEGEEEFLSYQDVQRKNWSRDYQHCPFFAKP